MEHCPEDFHPATRESDYRLCVEFPFAALALVVSQRNRIAVHCGAEGALKQGTLQRPVSASGTAQASASPGLPQDRCEAGCGGESIGRPEAPNRSKMGDELCREHCPHPRQRTDEGTVRVCDEKFLEFTVDCPDAGPGSKGFGRKVAHYIYWRPPPRPERRGSVRRRRPERCRQEPRPRAVSGSCADGRGSGAVLRRGSRRA